MSQDQIPRRPPGPPGPPGPPPVRTNAPPPGWRPPPPAYGPPFAYDRPPAYGPSPVGFGPHLPAPPVGGTRPSVLWIAMAWALFMGVTVVAIMVWFAGIFSEMRHAAPTQTAASGEWLDVTLDPADSPVIYLQADEPGDVWCDIYGSSTSGLFLTPVTELRTLTVNGAAWRVAFRIEVPEPGRYQMECRGDATRFGIGNDVDYGRVIGYTFGSLGGAFLAMVAAIVTTVVVVSRRRAAARLLMVAPYVPRQRGSW